jgi:hypothetical protein
MIDKGLFEHGPRSPQASSECDGVQAFAAAATGTVKLLAVGLAAADWAG